MKNCKGLPKLLSIANNYNEVIRLYETHVWKLWRITSWLATASRATQLPSWRAGRLALPASQLADRRGNSYGFLRITRNRLGLLGTYQESLGIT